MLPPFLYVGMEAGSSETAYEWGSERNIINAKY
ncbi:hypothetical protein MSKU15_2534 [Komagataeibacter diospyri]|nr:hypothetical protein MSKU15_2534 [Komagataeibacter diospyri]